MVSSIAALALKVLTAFMMEESIKLPRKPTNGLSSLFVYNCQATGCRTLVSFMCQTVVPAQMESGTMQLANTPK